MAVPLRVKIQTGNRPRDLLCCLTMRIGTLCIIALLTAASLTAQLTAPNAAGVTLGHIHLIVKDVDAQTRFLVDMLGGTVVMNDKLPEIQFPGVYILLRQGESSGPNDTAVLDHFGFIIRDLPAFIEKWKSAGLKVTQAAAARNHNQAYVTGPEGTHVEIFGDPSLPTPVQMDHIHYYLPPDDVPAIQAWYAKKFGLVPSTRESVSRPGNFMATDLLPSRMNLSLADAAASAPKRGPTKGHLIDHIGFEVKNLDALYKKLQAEGVKFEGPVEHSADAQHLKTATLTDPWGVRLELTEGLAPAK
jgi:catechol 2,3-dioxygenase-like lactoylglutathione lyase family enzyme